jgi:hypothetical protein
MRDARRQFGLGWALFIMMAAILTAAAAGAPAKAAEGHWRFTGYTMEPPQSQLDETDRGMRKMGRTSETKVTGAFQPAASGAGSVDLFFKNDDVDRRIYLTTLNFSFTTGVEMRALTPGQKLHFNGVLTMGGNALSKAVPASGNGALSVGVGDYFVYLQGAIDRGASGAGEFLVPRGGGDGDTMTIHVAGHLGSYGALSGTMHISYAWVPGAAAPLGDQSGPSNSGGPAADALGSRLEVNELDGLWTGVWTRRAGTNVFDAVWRSSQYGEVRDIVRLESLSGGRVVFTRDGNGGRYYGTFSADGGTISGTASWYTAGMKWSARVGGR